MIRAAIIIIVVSAIGIWLSNSAAFYSGTMSDNDAALLGLFTFGPLAILLAAIARKGR